MPTIATLSRLNLPRYIFNQNKLNLLANKLYSQLKKCCLCPRYCKVNRLAGEVGFCRASSKIKIYTYLSHFGEEPPISGQNGSGTIFFSNCSLGCVYCQNYKFSQLGQGREVEIEELAQIMLLLQQKTCHNINLVTPTHYLPQITQALIIAVKNGLQIPIVYNTSGYENTVTLNYLKGIVDIYLADMRYGGNEQAKLYSQTLDYVELNQKVVSLMYKQVGNLILDENGLAKSGLIIRHLVLPEGQSHSEKVLNFIARHISLDTYISLMSQYTPAYRAREFPGLSRRVTSGEYEKIINLMHQLGLDNGWIQMINDHEPYFSDTGMNLKVNDRLI